MKKLDKHLKTIAHLGGKVNFMLNHCKIQMFKNAKLIFKKHLTNINSVI